MLIASILALCLLVIASNVSGLSSSADLLKTFKDKLKATQLAQEECPATITKNETNLTWMRAMLAAFKLDQQDAVRQLAYAQRTYEQDNLVEALEHLQKASNWYCAYNFRLKRIYGLEAGEIPPIPVIQE